MHNESYDIIIVARDAWGTLWRRRQYLASEFSKAHRVLFVEPPYSLPRLLAGSPETTSRPLNRIARAFAPPHMENSNLHIATPIKPLPNHPSPFRNTNRLLEIRRIRSAMAALDMKKPILWLNPEYAAWLPAALPHSLVVYDVTDDWTQATLPERELAEIRKNDSTMLAIADLVFTVSNDLHVKKAPHNPNTIFMPNGVAPELYGITIAERPRELGHISVPIIGYTGSLHDDRLDINLIEFLARDKRFHQVFIGPDYLKAETHDRLATHKNITLVPAQPYHRLPAFVCHFDVCSIPHDVNPFTNSLDPIKAYEYLAAGKPIVSTDVDGMRPFFALVELASDHEDFLDKIVLTLEGRHKSSPAERRLFADRNSWQARAAEIMFHIKKTLENKNSSGASGN